MMSASVLEPDGANRLELARMLEEDLDLDELEEVIRSDPALALQVFRLAAVGRLGETRRAVSSLRQALVLTGTSQVKQWLTLLLARPGSSRNSAGYAGALVRARACELLARRVGPALAPVGFAAGLLSSLDALLDVPAASLAGSLPLSDELRNAAFGGAGPVGLIVLDAVDYQLGRRGRRRSGLPEAAFQDAFSARRRLGHRGLPRPAAPAPPRQLTEPRPDRRTAARSALTSDHGSGTRRSRAAAAALLRRRHLDVRGGHGRLLRRGSALPVLRPRLDAPGRDGTRDRPGGGADRGVGGPPRRAQGARTGRGRRRGGRSRLPKQRA